MLTVTGKKCSLWSSHKFFSLFNFLLRFLVFSLLILASSICPLACLLLFCKMETSKAEGKRSFKYNMVEEEEEEEDEDVSELGFGEDEQKKREMTPSSKRASGSGGSTPITCQAENCNADFTDARPYHRRHKVCEFHAKAPVVHVGGLQKRFCQQCSRFHLLSEFDENKRSCRKRLAGHNLRRRKSSSEFHGEGSH